MSLFIKIQWAGKKFRPLAFFSFLYSFFFLTFSRKMYMIYVLNLFFFIYFMMDVLAIHIYFLFHQWNCYKPGWKLWLLGRKWDICSCKLLRNGGLDRESEFRNNVQANSVYLCVFPFFPSFSVVASISNQ